jgi:hypothetical protein
LFEYNHDDADQLYTKPVVDLSWAKNNWAYLTKGMSDLELTDFEKARDQLEHYDKIYSIAEYSSHLNEYITMLEKRMQSNNTSIPMNIYRSCPANQVEVLFHEVEGYLQAYYDLIDDCQDYPHWQRKLQEDLGQSVSFLGIMMEEAVRDNYVESSAIYERFDSEKQIYFK